MPSVAAVSTIDFPHRTSQQRLREFAAEVFAGSFEQIDRLLPVFENTRIERRNLCQPMEYYLGLHGFGEQNREYVRLALEYATRAVEGCIAAAGLEKGDVTDLVVVSSTGLATPGLDALLINRMRLDPHVRRMSLFGLGCAGGVSGLAKACALAEADPRAVVVLVTVELCSLTFLRNDTSKSNFIGSSLFSDGVAACLVKGDECEGAAARSVRYVASGSRLYYDTLSIMGWEFTDTGFKVVFSPGIPGLIAAHVREDVTAFLARHGLKLEQVANLIFHPGGQKVLAAYEEALGLSDGALAQTRSVMAKYGNMSSATVLYVLERSLAEHRPGYGLMMAMGPGFSSEMVLLQMD